MAQPHITIRCSIYNTWEPQNGLIRDLFVHFLRRARLDPGDRIPAVFVFNNAITPAQKELFTTALTEVRQYSIMQSVAAIVKSWDNFLTLLNSIVESSPPLFRTEITGVTIGEPIGVPQYLILDLISNTSAAYTLFMDQDFNNKLNVLLNSWGTYLKSRDSTCALNENEWFSEQGLAVLESGLGKWTFDQTYLSDDPIVPKKFNLWDSFFTRRFKPGLRPIQRLSGEGVFVNNPCKSTVLRTATNIQIHDTFWLKEQDYSIYDILSGKAEGSLARYAKNFEGGSVYQVFLSPQDYHHWHSPVRGNIEVSKVFGGTYYAVLPDNGALPHNTDLKPGDPHSALIRSQPWLSIKATRAVYIIKPDPALHLEWVAFIAIGMAEVSTCEITRALGTVEVGEEIGMFHFGGYSHALLLKPKDGYKVVFRDFYETPIRPGQSLMYRTRIDQVSKASPVASFVR